MSENEDRLLRAQVVVDPDLGAIQIAGERVRDVRDDHRQLIPLFEMFLDDVEDLAEPILADHRHASYVNAQAAMEKAGCSMFPILPYYIAEAVPQTPHVV